MIDRILRFSIEWRVFIVVLSLLLVVAGLYSMTRLPIDAVPDVTSNQVQINTLAPGFAPLEMEKYVTFPIEVSMGSLPRKEEIRSISQFGLSQVTVTFEDENGGTRLGYTEQMCVIPPSDGVEGREHGWSALLDGLAGYLATDARQTA